MRRKFSILLSILSLSFLFVAAQNTTLDIAQQQQDNIPAKKILIIPYNPMMHLSDADHDIAEYSDKTQEQIRAMFRIGITQDVTAEIVKSFETHSMLADFRAETQQQLDIIYGSIGYSQDTVFPILFPKPDSLQLKHKTSLKKIAAKELEQRKKTGDVVYMNAKLSHVELLKDLSQKYGTDYFVFLNQMEIKTNYQDCLDLALQIYQRNIKVHYSVFDKTGKQVAGDVASIEFPSNSNNIGEIMTKNFPLLAEEIKTVVASSPAPSQKEKGSASAELGSK